MTRPARRTPFGRLGTAAGASPAPGPAGPRRPRRTPVRASERPGRERRTRGPGLTRATARSQDAMAPRGPAALTGRAILLGLVLCALVASLAVPLKGYLSQRGQIAALAQQSDDRTAAIEVLRRRQDQLADPAYIEAQARERLSLVMPGDTVFHVVERDGTAPAPTSAPASGSEGETTTAPGPPDATTGPAEAAAPAPVPSVPTDGVHAEVPAADGQSWLARLGESVQRADAG